MIIIYFKFCNYGNEVFELLSVRGDGMIFIVNVIWKVLVFLFVKCLVCYCYELDFWFRWLSVREFDCKLRGIKVRSLMVLEFYLLFFYVRKVIVWNVFWSVEYSINDIGYFF